MTVDRFARHADLYGPEGVFPAAVDSLDESGLLRVAAILRRHGWRPTKAEQTRIDAARRSTETRPPLLEGPEAYDFLRAVEPSAGGSVITPLGKRVLSVTDGELGRNRRVARGGPYSGGERGRYGAKRDATCEACSRAFKAVRKTARYCSTKCRVRARRGPG